jgi:hypothetical protein
MGLETAAFICSHVLKFERPVLLVVRSAGDWQFLCGDVHSAESAHVVGANHLFDRDERLRELQDLPVDWWAERSSVDAPWVRSAGQP